MPYSSRLRIIILSHAAVLPRPTATAAATPAETIVGNEHARSPQWVFVARTDSSDIRPAHIAISQYRYHVRIMFRVLFVVAVIAATSVIYAGQSHVINSVRWNFHILWTKKSGGAWRKNSYFGELSRWIESNRFGSEKYYGKRCYRRKFVKWKFHRITLYYMFNLTIYIQVLIVLRRRVLPTTELSFWLSLLRLYMSDGVTDQCLFRFSPSTKSPLGKYELL